MIEVGQSVGTVGEIKQVKILGIIGLVDQDETDWKVVVIDNNDPLASNLTGKGLYDYVIHTEAFTYFKNRYSRC